MRCPRSAVPLAVMGALILAGTGPTRADDGVPPPPTERELRRALSRYRHEPEVSLLVERAIALADADPARAHALARRARRSALLPDLRLGARRGRGRDRTDSQSADTGRTNLSADDDLALEASLVFRLGASVYARDEVILAREARARAAAREDLVRTVVSLYFERRRLQLERDLLGLVDAERLLRILEIEALLDGLTGGAFTRMRERHPP